MLSIQRVVYFASTGDSPGTSWPSVSMNVAAVGGTSISRDPSNGTFVGEAAWYDAGSGPSAYIGRPAYQNAVSGIIGGTHRGVPDMSAVANPRTGVWVYDKNAGGWIVVGGTSVALPVIAAITNNAGHFRLTTDAELTQVYTNHAMFRDITQGICGALHGVLGRESFGLGIAAKHRIEGCEIAEADTRLCMIGAKSLLANGEGAFENLFVLRVAAEITVQCGKIIEAVGDIGMVRAECLLFDGNRAFEGGFRPDKTRRFVMN